MTLRSQHTQLFFALRMLLAVAMLLFCLPSSAYASGDDLCPGITKDPDINKDSSYSVSYQIIQCTTQLFSKSVSDVNEAITQAVGTTAQMMFLLAIVFFGIKVTGRGAGWGDALGFLTRMGIVTMFLNNLGNFQGYMTGMQSDLVSLTSGSDPWGEIDKFVAKLIGYGAEFTLANGLIGILAAGMFSSSFGFTMFFFGAKAILDILFFVVQAVFVYITAVLVLLLMCAISPLIVPLAIFNFTERYVMSWLKIMAAAILTPMFLMMALTGFITPIEQAIKDIFKDLGVEGDAAGDFRAFTRTQESPYTWLMPSDAYLTKQIAGGRPIQNPSVPSNLNSSMRLGFNSAPYDLSGVNFGLNTVEIVKKLLISFAKLMVLTYLVRSLVDQMPAIASGIAGGGDKIFNMQPTQLEGQIKEKFSEIEGKITGGGKK